MQIGEEQPPIELPEPANPAWETDPVPAEPAHAPARVPDEVPA